MLIKKVTLVDGDREIDIPIGLEISKEEILEICQEIISNLWFDEKTPVVNIIEE